MRRLAAVGFLALSVSACAVESTPPVEEKTAAKQDEIFGGVVDNGNAATVFVYAINGNTVEQCSGTLIAVNGSYGYILTAHHCEGMQYINFGVDAPQHLETPEYFVEADLAHPMYGGDAGDPHDLRILRFMGTNPGLTIVPVTTNPDGATTQTTVDISGYGVTEVGDSDVRRHVTMNLSNQTNQSFLRVNQTGGKGSCSGDSGGPWYASVNGVKSVVGVTSYGDLDCVQYGAASRVQLDLQWIDGVLAMPVTENCDSCFASATSAFGACESTFDGCFADSDCAALSACIYDCPSNSQTCVNTCAGQHPNSVDKYNAIFDCAVCDTCSSLCDTQSCGQSNPTTTNAATTGAGDTSATGTGGSTSAGGAGGAPADDSTSAGDPADDGGRTRTVTTCVACAVGSSSDESEGALATLACLAGLGVVVARRRPR